MPTYAYACTACEHSFEVQQSFTDAALTACPECSGRVRKVFSNVGIVFKGSGFYRNDSRSTHGRDGKDGANGKDGADSGTQSPSGTPAKEPAGGEASPAKRPESPAATGSGAGTSKGTSNGTSSSGSAGGAKPAAPGNRKATAGSSPAA